MRDDIMVRIKPDTHKALSYYKIKHSCHSLSEAIAHALWTSEKNESRTEEEE